MYNHYIKLFKNININFFRGDPKQVEVLIPPADSVPGDKLLVEGMI